MEEASVMMPGLDYLRVKQALDVLETQSVNQNRNISIVKDYNVDNFSLKVERIILSYIDFINRVVWQKSPSIH